MQLSGLPNDIIPTFAAIACILLAPLIQAIWTFLPRHGILPSAVLLITLAFVLCGFGIGYAALTQHLVYTAPPAAASPMPSACGSRPRRM